MADHQNYSIYKFLYGDVLLTGEMPDEDSMTEIGKFKPDTFESTPAEADLVEEKIQQDGSLENLLLNDAGVESFSFETWQVTNANKILAMGGEVRSDGQYASSPGYMGIEKSVKMIGKAIRGLHAVTNHPIVIIRGNEVRPVSNGATGTLKMIFTVKTPEADDTRTNEEQTLKIMKGVAPTNGVVDDTADTFAFDVIPNFPTVTDYEFSIDGGTAYADVTVNPISVTTAVPVGDLLVRLKATTVGSYPREAGYTLANKTAFTL